MLATTISEKALTHMFKKADSITHQKYFVNHEWIVTEKQKSNPQWIIYDDDFSSLKQFIECTLSVNMTKEECKSGLIDLSDPYHYAINEVVSQIEYLAPQTKPIFKAFWDKIRIVNEARNSAA